MSLAFGGAQTLRTSSLDRSLNFQLSTFNRTVSAAMVQPDITSYIGTMSDAEAELLRLFSVEAPLTIFDIGSCEGEDSIRYARRFPRARIFAFEPLPANQEIIRANFSRFGVTNAELVPLALSDQNGTATFHVSSGRPPDEFAGRDWNYGNKSSSLLAPVGNEPQYGWIEFKQAIQVPTSTLDHFCRERNLGKVDFIHMDVQGAEYLVLQGARAMLPKVGALWLEVSNQELYAGQKLRHQIQSHLQDAGFGLSFEVSRGVEGDQFYLNRRHPRSWRQLTLNRLRRVVARARFAGGRLKQKLK